MDVTYAVFDTATIDDAIRRALLDYSAAVPRHVNTTLALTSALSTNGREIDVSTITGLLDVTDVWCPYDPNDDRPTVCTFEFWRDDKTVYLSGGHAVQATDTARIFYTSVHTIDGLDGATSTTIPTDREQLIQMGAIAYTLLSRAADLTEQVTVHKDAPLTLVEMAKGSLEVFRNLLDADAATETAEKARQR